MLDQLRRAAPNLAGLKVSDTPFESLQLYLVDGLDVFVGSEALIHRGLEGGAVGAVSALAAAVPELTLSAVRTRSPEASERAGRVRASIQRFPLQSALKIIRQRRGVRITDRCQPRGASSTRERVYLERLLNDPGGQIAALIAGNRVATVSVPSSSTVATSTE